jgi:hypothetical protein
MFSSLNDRITSALDSLDALYFFLQSTRANEERLSRIRQLFQATPRQVRLRLRDELRDEIAVVRQRSGAISSNSEFVKFFREINVLASNGHVLIPKWEIERRWFRNFGEIIIR